MRFPYRLCEPAKASTALIVASPHSGRYYSDSFRRASVLDGLSIRSSEDAYVDLLVESAPSLGAPLLLAEYPRAYVDLNRSPDEMDPAVVADIGRVVQTPRISSGLGVIPRVVANGRSIYRGKLSKAEANLRIEQIWTPYHAQLDELMSRAHERFGEAAVLDFHSMPHEALDAIARPDMRRPDVVLGDRFGAAARPDLVDALEAAFQDAGLVVSRNAPFAGAYVTQRYGRPARGWHAVQVEIDRSLYMDEHSLQLRSDFDDVKVIVTSVIDRAIGAVRGAVPLAAE